MIELKLIHVINVEKIISNMKITIIGRGRQSKRIQKILKKKQKSYDIYIPHDKNLKDQLNLNQLNNSKIIFICSPNNTHYEYIKKFNKKKVYIFCEKPPVTKLEHLEYLRRGNFKKVYFNFNMRFTELGKIFSNLKKYNLGGLLSGYFTSTKGLAFKKEYIQNWRSNKSKCKKGVYELVSIHIIDLINYYFDVKKIIKPKLLNNSKVGTSYDNSSVDVILKNQSKISIFSSYTAPYSKDCFLIFENGLINVHNNSIEIRGPRNNFDKNKNFVYPKLIKKIRITPLSDYNNSLEKSVNYFLKHVSQIKNFQKKEMITSLKSNSLILSR